MFPLTLNIIYINAFCFFLGHEDILLVRISYFGNNRIEQQCVINDDDCKSIAYNANIKLSSIVDIFYDNKFHFTVEHESNDDGVDYLFDSNYEAAKTLKKALQ